ncbi:MAG: dihydrodipicolinate synthase family protein [Candidatus Methylomirabilales bacterium]
MKQRFVLDGIVPILQTPFLMNGAPDEESLARLADEVIAAGAAGLIYPAVASEAGKLAPGERRSLLETVVKRVDGRVPVIAGVSAETLAESMGLAEHAQSIGAAGMLAQAPAAMRADAGALEAFFRRLATAAPLVLMIQDLDWQGEGMPVELIRRLFETLPGFRCIKVETVPAGPKYSRLLEATEGRLHVSGGWAVTQMLDGLARGVHAFMPEGSMVRIYRRIYDLFHGAQRGGVEVARRIIHLLVNNPG